jgi:hypothetical protein
LKEDIVKEKTIKKTYQKPWQKPQLGWLPSPRHADGKFFNEVLE